LVVDPGGFCYYPGSIKLGNQSGGAGVFRLRKKMRGQNHFVELNQHVLTFFFFFIQFSFLQGRILRERRALVECNTRKIQSTIQ
jgi:hypothetical protein